MDTPKTSISDPLEEEQPKPRRNMAAQAYCATVVANLEGWRGGTLPGTKEARRITIDQLDTRVRRLENLDGIHPPPPMDMPSWDSLTYRVARLHRNMPPEPIGVMNKLMATPPHIMPSTALLQSTVAAIGGVGPQSWAVFIGEDGNLEGENLLQAAAQFLCYLAGKRGYRVVGSFELRSNCILALDMSLDADANSGFYVGPAFHTDGFRPRPRPGPGFVPRMGRVPPTQKACCGCCACSCHRTARNTLPRPNVLRWITEKYHTERRASRMGIKGRIAGAFKKLAFWRCRPDNGRETDSDVSSISTRSSSTFA
ncbi:hypothetical protein GGS21DRAFT_177230 [Xylaria nigripes]|nr:hypothetical protein GGS21DRAFT_177230 [Xylaria nigripes]